MSVLDDYNLIDTHQLSLQYREAIIRHQAEMHHRTHFSWTSLLVVRFTATDDIPNEQSTNDD